MLKAISSNGALRIIIAMGNITAAIIDAKDTNPLVKNIIIQIKIIIYKAIRNWAIIMARPIITPKLVATPLPPLKLRNIVQLCPMTATKPKIIRNDNAQGISLAPAIESAIKVGQIKPLPMSSINAVMPKNGPRTLKALVAPILPEPCLRISTDLKILPIR